MDLKIVQIGNSLGIRIPKAILEKCGFKKRVHMSLKGSNIVLEPLKSAREGWDEAFEKIDKKYPKEKLDWEFKGQNKWDEEGWEW